MTKGRNPQTCPDERFFHPGFFWYCQKFYEKNERYFTAEIAEVAEVAEKCRSRNKSRASKRMLVNTTAKHFLSFLRKQESILDLAEKKQWILAFAGMTR